MKRTLSGIPVALLALGFLSVQGALAQSTTPSAGTTAPSGTTSSGTTSSSGDMAPARTETASSAFGKLDMNKRGYLSSEDVSKLQGFDFKKADKNGDGRLDATEFNAAWSTYGGAK